MARFIEKDGGISPATPGESLTLTCETWMGFNVDDDLIKIRKFVGGKTWDRDITDPDIVDIVISKWVEYSEWAEYIIWLTGWVNRKPITLTGGSSGAQTDYQVKLTVPYDSDMQADFDDLRFTRADGETLIDAWLESKTDSVTADIWVEFPTTPADGVEQTYYMYYGNSGASSDWNIEDTFIFGDDFSGDLSKWIVDVGTPDIVDDPDGSGQKVMRLTPGVESVISDTNFDTLSYVLDYDIRGDSLDDSGIGGVSSIPWNAGDYQVLALGHPTDGFFGHIKAGGSWVDSGHPYAINTWYDIEHTRERGVQFKIYQNGTHIGTVADTTTTQDACIFRAPTGDTLWVKNPRVRKYAANPASYALGSEES